MFEQSEAKRKRCGLHPFRIASLKATKKGKCPWFTFGRPRCIVGLGYEYVVLMCSKWRVDMLKVVKLVWIDQEGAGRGKTP